MLSAHEIDPLRRSLGGGIASIAIEEGLTVVTGGTDAGIFALFGQAIGDRRTAPCIGVAPTGRVAWSDTGAAHAPEDEQLAALEPHHSHFLLVSGDTWGVEAAAMIALCDSLGSECASVAVIAGGGGGARAEVLLHVRARRDLIVLAGSGRFAGQLAEAVSTGETADSEIEEIAASRLVEVVGVADPPSALAALIRRRLKLKR